MSKDNSHQEHFLKLGLGFDRLARIYDFLLMITFGKYVMKSQTVFLKQYEVDEILVVGGGTGKLLIELLACYPDSKIVWLDISKRMIEQTRKRLAGHYPDKAGQVQFIHGTVLDLNDNQQFDLICNMYVLDCFVEQDLVAFLNAIKRHLKAEGHLLMADFNVPQKPFVWRSLSRFLIWFMYLFFYLSAGLSVWQLPDFNQSFAACGFSLGPHKEMLAGLIISRVYYLESDIGIKVED